LIFFKTGDFPKTHYLDKLFNELKEVYKQKEIVKFYKKHSLEFKVLEDAYITSRYLPKEFTKDEVHKIIEFTKSVFKFLEKKQMQSLYKILVGENELSKGKDTDETKRVC